jgi:fructose/tagatose bisphosphate aldolase
MGRGRQKAKNTKVARELKYYSPSTDYSALEAELGQKAGEENEDFVDRWADDYEATSEDERVVDLDEN